MGSPHIESSTMNYTIGVAIASYNGINYLERQLDSICRQTVLPKVISISDDCSTDGTFEFLQKYRNRSKVPIVLNSNTRQLGVIENFMAAFHNCDTDYIAYCDQDDVWDRDKIAACCKIIDRGDISLVFHRSEIVDSELRSLGRFEPANITRGLYAFPHFPDNLWGFGHQMIFSNQVLRVMNDIRTSSSPTLASIGTCFDLSLLVAAGTVGNIFFVDQELIKFRRHDKTVSPAGNQVAKKSIGDRMDAQMLRIQGTLTMIDAMLSESETKKIETSQDPALSSAYVHHLRLLSKRYTHRKRLYESTSRLTRLRELVSLVASNAYGSIRRNKLPIKQLLSDGLRCIR